jgi:hypothetical protein
MNSDGLDQVIRILAAAIAAHPQGPYAVTTVTVSKELAQEIAELAARLSERIGTKVTREVVVIAAFWFLQRVVRGEWSRKTDRRLS